METIVISQVQVDATHGLLINDNREYWDRIYLEIRKLCVVKGERIRKYAPKFAGNPRKSIQFKKGDVKVNQEFWDSLKPAHKAQLTCIINKIKNLYIELRNA